MTLSIEAIHEAAHAVMAVLANVPFEYVTIEPSEVNGVMTMGHIKLTGGISRGRRSSTRLYQDYEFFQQQLQIVATL